MSMSEALTKALPLLYALEQRGYETVFVGGCVRDTLLGKPLKDVDIATAASPEQVIATFPHTVPTGLQHGTVTVVHEKETYEITTFRTESAYEQYRRPTQVQFVTSLNEDLLRRDFTINSMAMRYDETIIDPFHGQDDLRSGLLRCVGDADARLQEDALRIVRAVRFAAAYELRIAHMTWRAIIRHRGLLAHIAMERVGLELDKMIAGSRPYRAASLLASSGMLAYTKDRLPAAILEAAAGYKKSSKRDTSSGATVSPEAQSERMTLVAQSMRRLHRLEDNEDRWAAVCAALSMQIVQASELFALLRYSSSRTARLAAILGVHGAMAPRLHQNMNIAPGHPDGEGEIVQAESELQDHWRLTVLKYGMSAAESWLGIVVAIPELVYGAAAANQRLASIEDEWNRLRQTLHSMAVRSIRELAVKGKDLLSLTGKPSGPWLGQLLQSLVEAAALGRVPNEKGPLLDEAAAVLNKDEN
ncbi:CCA tRNA nucleotidyltransferase [Paenibacillus rhizovicinus]|uniref:CCA tRNA nucleotidyltransferase n=1 Tax=Paenibacillus rhizovicinus TaxID=2704463 RepID=A0A6C0NVE0_9BACL|nr:CCA tRNA nucleotidyltransferase [Paenibacillus rhizovicinus]QHW30155.1 CCA tRNA nucleotidyltransferase [Paenibacillus rhizovicinus]